MAKGDDIQERLIELAVTLIALCEGMPRTLLGKHISDQLVRSGTSAAANYGEARVAESRRDFMHKLKVVAKELNEAWVWLEIVRRSRMFEAPEIRKIEAECTELSKIVSASIRTTRSRTG